MFLDTERSKDSVSRFLPLYLQFYLGPLVSSSNPFQIHFLFRGEIQHESIGKFLLRVINEYRNGDTFRIHAFVTKIKKFVKTVLARSIVGPI